MILLTATDNILPISNAKENSLCSRLLLFFSILDNSDIPKRFVTKAALAKARMKLKYQAFIELNQKLLDQVRAKIRIRHYSIRSEQSYLQWINRYILFHGKNIPKIWGRLKWNPLH